MQTEISKKYLFLTEENISAPELEDPVIIFNDWKYLSLWPGRIVSCYLKSTTKNRITGFCHFHCEGNTAWSPFQAPFASIYIREEVRFEILARFISLMTRHLHSQGYTRICLKHYPDFYSGYSSAKLITALFFEGFKITQTDINHYLKITHQPFEKIVHPMQRRRIKKCLRNDYKFKSHPNNELEFVFRRILDLRMQKNIPVNISRNTLEKLFNQFPDQYHLFSVLDGERIIATTCTVSVNKTTLYNFLPASDAEYNSSSPMVYLIKNIYEYARVNHYRFLDLGVSSINNQPQSGLISFKEHLGGISGVKFKLEKISDPLYV